MSNLQRSAKIVGILFIVGTVSGILSLNMVSILNSPDYLIKLSENKSSVIFSVFCIMTMGVALSMMSVILYPIIKKYNETLAIGSVQRCSRDGLLLMHSNHMAQATVT